MVHVEVFGTGVPAVFVHGSFGWGLDTFPHQRALADSYQIHLLDRAGFGDSPPAEQLGWPTDTRDAVDVLDSLGGAHLVGHSYGAVVALLAAGLRPRNVRSLVVIEPPLFGVASRDPAARGLAEGLRRLAGWAPALDAAGYAAAWAETVLGLDRAGFAEWTRSWGDREWAAAESSRLERDPLDTPVNFDVLARLRVPVVVVVGGWPSSDVDTGSATGPAFRAVAEAIADRTGAELVVFGRSTHGPQVQQPDEFNELLRRIWASENGASYG